MFQSLRRKILSKTSCKGELKKNKKIKKSENIRIIFSSSATIILGQWVRALLLPFQISVISKVEGPMKN